MPQINRERDLASKDIAGVGSNRHGTDRCAPARRMRMRDAVELDNDLRGRKRVPLIISPCK